jgi:hypothetical protein
MPWRIYPMKQKYTKKDGTVSIYKLKNKKWINSSRRYKPQKRGFEKKSLYSTRFGFLDLYNRKEQHNDLICPSGYSVGQCFGVMRKLWYGYHKARTQEKDIRKMEKYARAIQNVQKDMGIKTTSFPHLGLYGDLLILRDKEKDKLVVEDHCSLKQKQEEFEKWQAENSRKIQEVLQKPDKEKGEVIVTFADDYGPSLIDDDIDEDDIVPDLLEPDVEKGETILTITDDIPFQSGSWTRKASLNCK